MAKKSTKSSGSNKSSSSKASTSKSKQPWNTQEYRDAKFDMQQSISEHRVSAARSQEAARIVAEAEAARIRHIAGTAPDALSGRKAELAQTPYIRKLLKKNPDQEFSIYDNKTGRYIKFNKGMHATPRTPKMPTTPADPTTPIIDQPPPVAARPEDSVFWDAELGRKVFNRDAALAEIARKQAAQDVMNGALAGDIRQQAAARTRGMVPQPGVPVPLPNTVIPPAGNNRIPVVQPKFNPNVLISKGSKNQKLDGFGAKADFGNFGGGYGKKRNDDFL